MYQIKLENQGPKSTRGVIFFILDMMYFIEEPGELSCREGSKILTIQECTSACRDLGKITGLLKNGEECYISGNRKKCRQDGRRNSKTCLVCIRNGNIHIWISIRDEKVYPFNGSNCKKRSFIGVEVPYFIGQRGGDCADDLFITDKTECKEACGQLNMKSGMMRNNMVCYMANNGKCRQDGRFGKGTKTSPICKRKGKPD